MTSPNTSLTSSTSTTSSDTARIVDVAITSRRSIRRFRPDPVLGEVVRDILRVAGHAPSGTNMQPWNVVVLGGAHKQALSKAVLAATEDGTKYGYETPYYPLPFPEPYLSRRRKVGWDLYGALGIAKGETQKMHVQHGRNYVFFDAPVGMIFTIDRALKIGSWLDYGMYLENVAVAARGRGLATCMQAAFGQYHDVIRKALELGDDRIVVCGMALGYADMSAPENLFPVERASLDDFASFRGV